MDGDENSQHLQCHSVCIKLAASLLTAMANVLEANADSIISSWASSIKHERPEQPEVDAVDKPADDAASVDELTGIDLFHWLNSMVYYASHFQPQDDGLDKNMQLTQVSTHLLHLSATIPINDEALLVNYLKDWASQWKHGSVLCKHTATTKSRSEVAHVLTSLLTNGPIRWQRQSSAS